MQCEGGMGGNINLHQEAAQPAWVAADPWAACLQTALLWLCFRHPPTPKPCSNFQYCFQHCLQTRLLWLCFLTPTTTQTLQQLSTFCLGFTLIRCHSTYCNFQYHSERPRRCNSKYSESTSGDMTVLRYVVLPFLRCRSSVTNVL